MSDQEKKYWAFISYSHQDKKWGDWLHKSLETYKIPQALSANEGREGSIPKRIFPIFRDREELPSAADLGDNINQALKESRYLIVDGEPNASDKPELRLDECFPEAIKYKVSPDGTITDERVEPIAADARKGKDGKTNALLKLIAGVLGVNYDALKQRDQARRIRSMQYLTATALVLLALFSFLSVGFYQAKNEADDQRSVAEQQTEIALQQKQIAEQEKVRAQEETKKAQHNIGLVFAEKAQIADKEHKQARASLYALASLTRLIPDKNPLINLQVSNVSSKKIGPQLAIQLSSGAHYEQNVLSVTFSPNGKTIASGGKDNTVRLWDADSGKLLTTFIGHKGPVTSVALSPDGKILASGSQDKTIRLWNVASGETLTVFNEHIDGVTDIAFSPDGKTLASGSHDNSVRLWNINSGTALMVFTGHLNAVTSVAFSPDGKTLASGAYDNTARLWNIANGKFLAVFKGHTGFVNSIKFSPDGNTLASGSNDKTLRLWDISSGDTLAVLEGHNSDINSIAFSPDRKVLASGSEDNTVRLWSVASGKLLTIIEGAVTSIAFSPDSKILVTGNNNSVHLWETASGKALIKIKSNYTTSLAFSPDGRLIASGSGRWEEGDVFDDVVRLWDVANGKEFAIINAKNSGGGIASVVFSSDSNSLALVRNNGTVLLWDIVNDKVMTDFDSRTSYLSIAFSPDGRRLALAEEHSTVRLWDIASGKVLAVIHGHTDSITTNIVFSVDGTTLAWGNADNTFSLWSINNLI